MSARTVGIDVRRATWAPQLGISRYARGLLKEMARAESADLELVPVDLAGSPHWKDLRRRSAGKGHGFVARLVQEQLSMPLISRRLELLHLPWYEGPLVSGCPLVVNVHDLDTIDNPEGYRWRFRAYYNTLLRVYLQRATRIIVPSDFTLEQLEARWPGRPYVRIHYGVDDVFSPGPHPPDRGEGAPSLLYTGGFGHRKRLEDLLDAFATVVRARPGTELVVAGNAPPDFVRAVDMRGISRHVRLTGFVDDGMLAQLYRESDLLLYPSMLEGFGFPVLEAMASGTPVVATTGGSVPEIAGNAALLVEPRRPDHFAEAILSLLDDPAEADRLRGAGLRRAAAFSWGSTAARTLGVYRAALEASNSD